MNELEKWMKEKNLMLQAEGVDIEINKPVEGRPGGMKLKLTKIDITMTATPSLNKLHGNRWQMSNWKKKYLKELYHYEYCCQAKEKVKLTIFRYGSRLLDNDNLIGGCKPLIDALKEKGLIRDDSPGWIDLHILQTKVKRGEEETIVTIEEIADTRNRIAEQG